MVCQRQAEAAVDLGLVRRIGISEHSHHVAQRGHGTRNLVARQAPASAWLPDPRLCDRAPGPGLDHPARDQNRIENSALGRPTHGWSTPGTGRRSPGYELELVSRASKSTVGLCAFKGEEAGRDSELVKASLLCMGGLSSPQLLQEDAGLTGHTVLFTIGGGVN
jgi:hypothetical protein